MLTRELAIAAYERGRVFPDRLTRIAHARYVGYAERLLEIYRSGIGRTRRDLHRAAEAVFAGEPDCEIRRIRAFQKLLDDASVYEADQGGRTAALRLAVFGKAAAFHPLVARPDRFFENAEAAVKERIARELGRPWGEIEAGLYADVLDFQRLRSFQGYPSPEALLSRYNVAQVQACLYRAERVVVRAAADFKTILRYAKLARLLHDIRRLGPSEYRFEFTGPASILRETRRYGVHFARFVPALLACRDWRLEAAVRTPWGGRARLLLSDRDGLRGHLPPPAEFDSSVEEDFARRFGPERDGWTLLREGEIVHEGQAAFVPDFVLRRRDGAEALLEIVGFWTPEYLARKRDLYRRFRGRRILMAVPVRSIREGAEVPEGVLVYRAVLRPEAVLEALGRRCPSEVPER